VVVVYPMYIVGCSAGNLNHGSQGHSIDSLSDVEQQGFDDGQRERDLEIESRALAGGALDGRGAFQAIEHGFNYIHSHAAAGNGGHLFGSTQAGTKDQVESVAFSQGGRIGGADDPGFNRFADYFLAVDSASIIADLDYDLVALMISIELHGALGRLSGADALLRRFNSVVYGIPHQVGQRLGQHIEDALIQIGVLAAQY